ncbi:MAG: hypothetical protein K2K29_06600, partial [Muribaculaceae bacterium]|nr:hypothetical protein [Muribaculaceae bacterium]
YTSDVFYRIEWDDAHNARLIPRPAASNYTNTFDELETGRYRIHILPYLYDTNSVANADVYLGSYYIEGATEAPIVSQTPPANSAIRATDWEDLVFAFNSEMIPGDSDLEITIKDADGNTVATYTPMDIEWDGDNHSVRIPLNPVIKRGDKEMVYSVFIPRGFVKQSSGAGLPSTEAEFTVTVGKFVIIEGNYPKYVYSPDPKTLTMNTSLNKFVFTYYGADSIELGTELPDIKANGKSMVESCTVTIGRDADDFPTATINFKLLTASTSPNGGSTIPKDGYTYTLDIPALAWTISRGEHVYSTEEHITYKKDAVKNVTSATVQTALINSTCTVKYDDVTTEEMTRAEAVANYSTVKIALSGGKTSQLKAGSGVATLKKASDNSVIATYNNPSSYNVSSINYTTTLTEDMFEEGEAYYWELPANAILGYNNKQLSTTLKVNFSIPAAGQAPEARAIRVVNTAGKPRVRLDHIEFECETDNSSYGFAIARNFAVGGPYIADKDGNRLSYIESDEDTGDVEVDIYQFSHPTRKGNMISYKILPIITEQGEYTIVVPEKAFKIDGVDYNSELRHHFEIKDNHVEWSIPVYEQITTRDGIEGCESHPQKGFNRITLTFPEDIDLKLATNQYPVQFNRVWIEGSGNNSYEMAEPVNDVKINVTSEANEVYIDFSPALTTDGNYRLVLPQGAVQMMGAFDEYVPVNSYMAYFTIKDSTTATISPAPGSELTELSKVEFTFTKAAQVLADSNPAAPAGLYDADMNEMEGHKLSVSIEGTKAIISINPPVEADGSYNIIVPAGRFRCKASASAAEEEATEYRISYNVVDPSDATVTPAAGTVAPSMSNFEFEFLKAVDVDLTDQAAAAVHDAAGNVLSQYTVALSMDKDYESDVIVFANVTPSITTSGEYTLVLAANSAACKRTHTSEARNNEEISVPFTVKNPTDSRVTPASGSTRAIAMVADITVVYQNAAKVERGEGTITVLAADGVTPLTEYTATAAVNSDNSGVITITPAITTGGNYRIKVEAGTFICHLDAADEGTPSR